jgi:group I intron endonuclease
MKTGIYIIQNKKNKKVYVGSGVDIKRRWREHKKLLRKNKHHSPRLQHSWNKYGEENFQFILLEPVRDPLHLVAVEQTFLDYYKCYEPERGYNICRTSGSCLGAKRSEETKKKISKAKIGKRKKNTKGYHFHPSRNKYKAEITTNGKKKHLGYYNTEKEAHAAYLEAANN